MAASNENSSRRCGSALSSFGFELVEIGDGPRGVSERRVAGYVIDALSADIDGAALAHAFELPFCRSASKLPCAPCRPWYNVRARLERS